MFFVQHIKEMPIAYYVSDVVVSSSIEPEAFGRISVEAQAMRRPILASNHGGSTETIVNGKSGFLFENNNPESLAENLNKLIEMDKDKLQSIGNEGRKNILKKFGKKRIFPSPTSEQGVTALAAGASINGLRPIVIHERVDFMAYTFEQFANWISLWYLVRVDECSSWWITSRR